ncbi:bifunctional 4-hydroxy-2-oxoglutarate aldolase/2-dehydro-3-deoxy-phosphogluconate aldolase [Actinocrinis puniceicyclus]|uniref:Bifunctional 4-hydroxy-2-oxoglutarate aldolase/2-dehydro-3-deoxy-phosphogluconate aldolase n=1 Tax=Actinocrinis puniceicyclus TaxID=977794 RepID=A0A8J8BB91_9ACTN|nr:bifunctional 4-hydroxy-2-oxoglutarate aldolase/2-dehydro-3-deoxy-phosphogluconate aldolase [Actinocrinis puniceicyclus]MBS2963787.1 bifunctional 4-hydroxy-2-oxoglutarate aldolase/2-dehydro-3-deoxy-phosphogluconate aldolase [Actinocrinis puniceicyclus]
MQAPQAHSPAHAQAFASSARLDPLEVLAGDRVLCIVRANQVADPAGLAATLAGAGIRLVEFTFTIPGVLDVIEAAAEVPGSVVGAGTVLTAGHARDAVAAGARFLLTPDVRPEVATAARACGVPLIMGALTPTELSRAVDLGAAAVKVFPARLGGPAYLRDLLGPFPDARLIATGGVNAANAGDFVEAGALAVGAGADIVPPTLVEQGEHTAIAERAEAFVRALR